MDISDKNILFVGPGGKGGIKAVLDTYAAVFNPFKAVYSQTDGNHLTKFFTALWGYIVFLFRLTTDCDIKIIHIHSASNGSFWRKSLFIRIARIFNKKIIFHCHGGGFKDFFATNPSKIKSVLDKCDIIVTLSPQWEAFFKSIGCKNVVIINNPIPNPSRSETTPHDSIIHVLFIGKICAQKGVFDMINMIVTHRDALENRIILHIGGNDQVELLNKQIMDNHLENIVKYEGWVSGAKKDELFNLADIFILPSYIEAVPISILEAMSYGIPVIATNVGGIPSILNDSQNGMLINPGDKESMFSALSVLIDTPDLRAKMGKAALVICKPYLINCVKKSLDNLYNQLYNG